MIIILSPAAVNLSQRVKIYYPGELTVFHRDYNYSFPGSGQSFPQTSFTTQTILLPYSEGGSSKGGTTDIDRGISSLPLKGCFLKLTRWTLCRLPIMKKQGKSTKKGLIYIHSFNKPTRTATARTGTVFDLSRRRRRQRRSRPPLWHSSCYALRLCPLCFKKFGSRGLLNTEILPAPGRPTLEMYPPSP